MGIVETIQDWALREIAQVKGAPLAICVVLALGGIAGWFSRGSFLAERIAVKDERIALLQEKVSGENKVSVVPQPITPPLQSLASRDQLQAPTLKNLSFRLVDVAAPNGLIRNRTFEDCVIYGPAVITPGEFMTLTESTVVAPGDIDAVLWRLAPTQRGIIGALRVEHSQIIRSRLIGVAFTGSDATIAKIREGFVVK